MGNANSAEESDSDYSDSDVEAGASTRRMKRKGAGGGEEEKKGSADGEVESKSRPGTAASTAIQKPARVAYKPPPALASDSESDSDDDLDEDERQQRARLDIRRYEYDQEQVEELIMMSGMTEQEINKLFKRFFGATKFSKNPALMKRKVFLNLPEVKVNPLKRRLAHVFGFSEPAHAHGINFGTFVQKLAIFSERGSRQDKLRASFKMYDLDNNNRITRQNLSDIVHLLVDLGVPQTEKQREEQEEVFKVAVDKVFQEASSHKDLEYISFDDYRAIVLETDLQAKVMLRLI